MSIKIIWRNTDSRLPGSRHPGSSRRRNGGRIRERRRETVDQQRTQDPLIVLIAIVVWPVSLGLICAVGGDPRGGGMSLCRTCDRSGLCDDRRRRDGCDRTLMSVAYPPAALMTTGIGLLLFVLGLIATSGNT